MQILNVGFSIELWNATNAYIRMDTYECIWSFNDYYSNSTVFRFCKLSFWLYIFNASETEDSKTDSGHVFMTHYYVVQRKHFFKNFSEESASGLLKYWRNISLVLRGLWESWICDRLMIIITTNCTKQFESGWILSKYYYDKYIINICV